MKNRFDGLATLLCAAMAMAAVPASDAQGVQAGGAGQPAIGGQAGNASGGAAPDRSARREAIRQKLLDRFDTNHDGVLDDNEKAALQAFKEKRRAERQANGGGAGIGQGAGQGAGLGAGAGAGLGGLGGGRHRWRNQLGSGAAGAGDNPAGGATTPPVVQGSQP